MLIYMNNQICITIILQTSVMQQSQSSSYDFDRHSFIQQADQSSMSHHFQKIDLPISVLRSTFDQLDKQGRGFIHKSTLQSTIMLTSQQYDKQIIKQQIDQCGDEINYSRFLQIFRQANTEDDSTNQWLYQLYDKDKKGYIDANDLKRASEITGIQLQEDQLQEMLMTERNMRSGKVDFEDFKYFMEETIQFL